MLCDLRKLRRVVHWIPTFFPGETLPHREGTASTNCRAVVRGGSGGGPSYRPQPKPSHGGEGPPSSTHYRRFRRAPHGQGATGPGSSRGIPVAPEEFGGQIFLKLRPPSPEW